MSASVIEETQLLEIPGRRHSLIPSKTYSARSLPVPIDGTLNELKKVHHSWERMNAIKGNLTVPRSRHAYAFRQIKDEAALAERPVAKFHLRRLDDRDRYKTFDINKTVEVAALLRHATLESAQNSYQQFPAGIEQYVAGHILGRNPTIPRFAYLPLPSIGHEHTGPGIRRALIAEPRNLTFKRLLPFQLSKRSYSDCKVGAILKLVLHLVEPQVPRGLLRLQRRSHING